MELADCQARRDDGAASVHARSRGRSRRTSRRRRSTPARGDFQDIEEPAQHGHHPAAAAAAWCNGEGGGPDPERSGPCEESTAGTAAAMVRSPNDALAVWPLQPHAYRRKGEERITLGEILLSCTYIVTCNVLVCELRA